jgi:hypothetical protein
MNRQQGEQISSQMTQFLPLYQKIRGNDRNYFSEMDTFEFPGIASLSEHSIRVVQDHLERWRIFLGLVVILMLSLILLGISVLIFTHSG